MRILLISFFFFCLISNNNAQSYNGRQVTDRINAIPIEATFSTMDISEYVNQNFITEKEKVYAIYKWVSSNIRYDTDSADIINLGPDKEAKITAALRRRKGVCENFAAVFNDICFKSGLTSFVVDGYTKQNGRLDKAGHSWSAVNVDGEWLLCDPTWDESTGNSKWFLVPPSEMILTHMPFDPIWQLLEYPVTHRQFNDGNYFNTKNRSVFNYKDSIAAYVKMDNLQKFNSTARRIEQTGVYNKLVDDRLKYNKMHLEIIRQDKDVNLYNSSVEDLNNATDIYNRFVQFRNNQFSPAIPDDELNSLLMGIDTRITSAHKKLDEIKRSEAVFKFGTDDLRNRLNVLSDKIKVQKEFLQLYVNTPVVNRSTLFYKVSGVTK